MKNKERIAILEAEISRLKVANRNNIYRIEAIESHLAEQHKGANFSKLNSSEIPNTCLNIKPEPPEDINAEMFKIMRNTYDVRNLKASIKPDFIPDWKGAPEDAVCVAMDGNGDWFWWRHKPTSDLNEKGRWNTMSVLKEDGFENGLTETDWFADSATNADLLPPDYWKSTLMMRPDANAGDWSTAPDWATHKAMDANGVWNWYSGKPYIEDGMNEWCLKSANDKYKLIPNHPPSDKDWTETLEMRPDASELNQAHKNVLVNVRSFEPEYTSEPSGIISVPFGLTDSEEKSFIEMKMKAMHDEFEIKRNEIIEKFKQPDALSAPDYTHLLPDGYEFCSEEDAEKWVKVEMMDVNDNDEYPIGYICNFTCFKGRYRPIRPIQYKVTTHEIVTAVPDPYMPDWSKAPEWVYVHAFDFEGKGHWYGVKLYGNERYLEGLTSPFTLPPDLDWKQSLRVKPN